jgi:hypothetical protein
MKYGGLNNLRRWFSIDQNTSWTKLNKTIVSRFTDERDPLILVVFLYHTVLASVLYSRYLSVIADDNFSGISNDWKDIFMLIHCYKEGSKLSFP